MSSDRYKSNLRVDTLGLLRTVLSGIERLIAGFKVSAIFLQHTMSTQIVCRCIKRNANDGEKS